MSAVKDPLLVVDDLVVEYGEGPRRVQAVSGVSLHVDAGETLGLVGESGCGKSTLARSVLQLVRPKSGSVRFSGTELTTLPAAEMRRMRQQVQMIFQDPIASLNPRRSVGDIVAEPLIIAGVRDVAERERRVREVLSAVGLEPDAVWQRRASEFSGGQCQRISIARTLVLQPQLVVCDEPVSALDVSIRAQIINLLEAMKARYGLTLVFVAHDLAVIKAVSDRVAVMYLGRLCEVGPAEQVFAAPAHPYTSLLLAAIPSTDPDAPLARAPLNGELPSPMNPPSGCRFRTRCPKAQAVCAEQAPPMRAVSAAPGHAVACHFPNALA
ncbi:MAG: ATP-binding cassette domain-containing protein [Cytophagales bacterium]|nr:ATP-binding cassette domain-containing protein [Rhizobacter sp.]